ncbi:IS21 family transposase [Flaviflexus salsibiostraticola]|uniref:IS21 family transposase n=1 Tax=Flaviflexus salsibiostraticola TaxID=1282737 RepID=A0A3Q8WU59_9ACTO|nr:IS21 family transposase [Flaviflexus salsibiostraticola]AZN29095.1 IS21 family transposase [Flaviflexus salsibiostraticola]AZN29235.1 IS21 family transposase [Flaviflexus salsibiostraticola]AZN29549.1 IS21 family transposase [Flaviflexus salsibiostraticola]AZN29831.1 IS21 family transposase [Flaviflexus salsibiostraticola]AZN29846.1 IS21 family transposase [Flaviflexus salsibiostraticola]
MHDWEKIRVLAREGVPKARIAAELGISRNTVDRAVKSDQPPRYVRTRTPTKFGEYEARIRWLLEECPTMPASVIGERVGWPYSERALRQNVARIRPEYAPRRLDPADRLEWEIGDVAQCDLWFPNVDIPIGNGKTARFPVLTMILAWSKYPVALMIPSRQRPDLLLGMWDGISTFGRVPRRLLWDNEAGIGRYGKLGQEVAEFCGTLGVKLVQAKPYDPETKGVVERFNSYLETSFLPGRTFASPKDFNAQLAGWLEVIRGKKPRGKDQTRGQGLTVELEHMGALPPVDPAARWTVQTRLGRDYYIEIGANAYSVDPRWIGHRIDVTMDLSTVQVSTGGKVITTHERLWGSGGQVTDPDHVETARKLRATFQQRQGLPGYGVTVQGGDLAVYDQIFDIEVA